MMMHRQIRVWAGRKYAVPWALALFLFAAAGARLEAQSGAPATDVFASNGSSTPVYQDSFSSSCDEKNHGSLA